MLPFDYFTQTYADAVYAKDQDAFLALYAPDVIVFDTWDKWLHPDRHAWAEVVKAWFTGLGEERVKVSFSPVTSSIDGDSAFFCATTRYAAIDAAGNELRSMENRLSWVLKRNAEGWRIVHEHTSAPADPGTLQVRLRRP